MPGSDPGVWDPLHSQTEGRYTHTSAYSVHAKHDSAYRSTTIPYLIGHPTNRLQIVLKLAEIKIVQSLDFDFL